MADKETIEAPVTHWFHPRTLLDKTFEIGIILKGLDGAIELIGAALLFILTPQAITHLAYLLTNQELAEDPNDFLAGHILQYANELAGKDKWFATFFLTTHGLIKIVLVLGLLRNRPWAYPFAFTVLGGFTAYQLYLIATKPSIGIVLLTLFDIVIIWLTWREYKQFRARQTVNL